MIFFYFSILTNAGCPVFTISSNQKIKSFFRFQHFNECWLSCFPNPFEAVPKPLKVVHRGQCDLAKPDCSLKGKLNCDCQLGHSGPKCDKCMPNYWAYTSFGCRGKTLKLSLYLLKLIPESIAYCYSEF
jgi:hypothetical protein